MSTIASPRVSTSQSLRSPASSRTSLELPPSGTSRPTNARRNRAALRDYYNLKASSSSSVPSPGASSPSIEKPLPQFPIEKESELDLPSFSPTTYVQHALSTSSLHDILKLESGLVSEIRGLDGERKALVYDNYSKLIAATDTIGRMRRNMDPLAPATSTLGPAVSHIAETAGRLSSNLQHHVVEEKRPEKSDKRKGEKETVRWVVGAPERIEELMEEGKRKQAEREWEEARGLLEKWKGVKGVEEVKTKCEEALKSKPAGSEEG